MASQYVFEIRLKGGTLDPLQTESQFVIIDGSSMDNFSSLLKDLGKLTSEPFSVQYIDDDEDVVSIDSQEEFKEFAKLAKQRSSRGLLVKMILESQKKIPIPTDAEETEDFMEFIAKLKKHPCSKKGDKKRHTHCRTESRHSDARGNECCHFTEEIKSKLISDLKKEILSEMKESLGAVGYTKAEDDKDITDCYVEDSDEILTNPLPEMSRLKCKTTEESKENVFEFEDYKIKRRLEKLELKKVKLLEKSVIRNTSCMPPHLEPGTAWPRITSGIAARCSLLQKVTAGKSFVEVWVIINDGTVPWNNVELRQTWSSPGFESSKSSVKCPPLLPGQKGQVMMKFKSPETPGPFRSYWHFFYEADFQWQQFGHFLFVNGCAKGSKRTASTGMTIEIRKGSKGKSNSAVYFKDKGEPTTPDKGANGGPSTHLTDSKVEQESRKHIIEGSLASAEIAADMAREAANAAFRRSIWNGPLTSSNVRSSFDDCIQDMGNLNLTDSGSDTDNNEDEETDPEFVFVDKPLVHSVKRAQRDTELTVGHKSEEKVVNETVTEDNNTFGEQATNLTSVINNGEKASYNNMTPDNMTPPSKKKKNEVFFGNDVVYDVNNSMKNVEYRQSAIHRGLASFPRLDPRVNYPVFPPRPPTCSFEETTPRTTIAQPYPYQNIAQQTSFSQPMHPLVQFQKMATTNTHYSNYPQIPTYTQMTPAPYYPPWYRPSEAIPNNMAPNQTVVLPSFLRPSPISTPFQQLQKMQTGVPLVNESAFNKKFSAHTEAPTINNYHKFHPSALATNKAPLAPTINAPAVPGSNSTGNKISSGLKTDNMHTNANIVQSEITPVAPDGNKKSDSVVQILPQALVDGAINVASTAYSTAWNALNNLRTTEDKAGTFDPVFENNMAMLVEMGFNNLERNARLLKRFNNDISQVIGVICATGGAHNLDID